jgi:type VI secretion system ImpM family protein
MSNAADLVRCDRVDLLGKVPWRNEYVRPPVPSPTLAGFDVWLGESVEAATRGAAGWGEAYATAPLQAFVFAPKKAGFWGSGGIEMLAGVVAPSADGAGRQYPIALAGTLALPSGVVSSPEILPLLVEDFWQGASDLLSETKVKAVDTIDHRFRNLQERFEFTVDGARGAYGEWIAALTANELWVSLFGAESLRTADQTIENVFEAVRPFRGVEHPRTTLTLRLPLGSAAGAAVCFWVDLVRRAAKWRATIPSFFWSHDGTAGTMLLHLGDPPTSTLAELWGPKRDRDEIFDLTLGSAAPAELGGGGTAPSIRSNPIEPVSELLSRVAAT